MKSVLLALSGLAVLALATTVQAEDAHRTDIPDGYIPNGIGTESGDACDILIRYDDGTDDSPGSGATLGYFSGDLHQFLGLRFNTPVGGPDHLVQSASWFSDFWVLNGMVDVTVSEVGNAGNSATGSVNVTGDGDWEVQFDEPICIPAGGEYWAMICPRPGVFGVVGEDINATETRSTFTSGDCEPANLSSGYMIWSCVTPCGATPTEETTWGGIKSVYR